MTEQGLDGAKVCAIGQEVRCESMAQGVGCCGFGQAKCAAHRLNSALDHARIERPAAGAAKEWTRIRETVGAGGGIGINRLAHSWDQRHEPYFAAFAFDAQLRRGWRFRTRQRQGFGDAQARAIKQGENGSVTCTYPWLGRKRLGFIDHVERSRL